MTERDLKEMEFEKVEVSPAEAGDELGFYYYNYEFEGESISLITNCNTDIVDEEDWVVEIFDSFKLSTTDREDVESLIKSIKQFENEAN
jgi:hypothetical protein